MNRDKIEKLFSRYELAFSRLDLDDIAELYADTFISAGPKGTIAESKKDFRDWAQKAREFYRSIGQNSARILSKNITPISNEYCMVTVHWGVTFEKTGDRLIEFDVSYILQETDGDPKVILFITHQDEEAAMKELGLKPEAVSS